MKLYLYIIDKSSVKVWGLTPGERTGRILGDTVMSVSRLKEIPKDASVIVVRGDYLIDDRLLKYLFVTPDIIVLKREGDQAMPFAAHVPASAVVQTVKYLEDPCSVKPPAGPVLRETEELPVSFNQRLRKFEPPFVIQVKPGQEDMLEKRVFDWSYKGVTDLVTKWLWPAPARRVVKRCVQLGLRPNHVTAFGFLLVVAAGWLFYTGYSYAGLAAGWLMTFLDTVDGKLARVTVTSSKFGHYFDHIIDLIHPPFWYLLWGMGLQQVGRYNIDTPLSTVMWWIFLAYIVGRLVEGTFKWTLGRFGIFCWRPVDSFFRLVTARRNPCMIILTVSLLVGRPDVGLLAVAWWTVLTTVFLLLRLAMAVWLRFVKRQELESWFGSIDSLPQDSIAVRWFSRKDGR